MMDKGHTDRLVARELARIAAGSLAQSLFRNAYRAPREHGLGKGPEPTAPGEIFRAALREVRQRYPAFVPTALDREYFDLVAREFRALRA